MILEQGSSTKTRKKQMSTERDMKEALEGQKASNSERVEGKLKDQTL